MVFKVYGGNDSIYLFDEWRKNNLSCSIDNTNLYSQNVYVFDFKKYKYEDLKKFFDIRHNSNLIYLYSEMYYEELKDLINFLETLSYCFILFMQE